ncbi:MAG: hypothetical protein LBP53_07205 [Candidatus Peribacteria bacterium]|nr:hypothetical protein [Candidatus Peribacteria bacterium]
MLYDPDGSDKANEVIVLSLMEGGRETLSGIDFSDDFKLTIFPRSEYAT